MNAFCHTPVENLLIGPGHVFVLMGQNLVNYWDLHLIAHFSLFVFKIQKFVWSLKCILMANVNIKWFFKMTFKQPIA